MLGYPAKDMIVLGCSANQQIRNGGGGASRDIGSLSAFSRRIRLPILLLPALGNGKR